MITSLKARYPGVEDAEIENYLVMAYCPVVAKLSGLSQADKDARTGQFLSEVLVALGRSQ